MVKIRMESKIHWSIYKVLNKALGIANTSSETKLTNISIERLVNIGSSIIG